MEPQWRPDAVNGINHSYILLFLLVLMLLIGLKPLSGVCADACE
jgi:hypothetical protein